MEYGFPKELYSTQKKFIEDAVSVIKSNKIGIFSSPTGTGKTLSLLCTAITFLKKNNEDDLFTILNNINVTEIYYCSRTHTQLSQVLNELKTNRVAYKSIILGSRKVYCINENVKKISNIDLMNETCRNLIKDDNCDYYGNQFYSEEILDIEDLKKSCFTHKSCPYYYTKNKAGDCKIVFLSYNLLFTREGRKSMDIDLTNKIIIVDEAHNIYDTVIKLNSAELSFFEIKTILGFKNISNDLKLILNRIIEYSSNISNDKSIKVVDFLKESKLSNFNMFEVEEYILGEKLAQKNDFLPIFELSKLLKLLTFSDNNGIIIINRQKIKFTPLNPKIYFEDLKKCKSLIFAGGTMEPISQIKEIFPDLKYFNYPSVNTNFLPIIISETSTKKLINLNYMERNNIIDDIVSTLIALSNPVVGGGVVVFVPSNQILSLIKKSCKIDNFRRRIYYEDEHTFEDYKKDPQILMAVMNGKLSEGINFSDDLCRLLIIVGVPYPSKSIEIDERCKYNKDYGTITAMKSVNQALGRAIRHKLDYSAMVLLDSRYVHLKDKLSPWISDKIRATSFVNGLIEINKFLKNQNKVL